MINLSLELELTHIQEPFYALAPTFTPPDSSWILQVLANNEVPTLWLRGNSFIDGIEQGEELIYLLWPDVDLDAQDELNLIVDVYSCIRFHSESDGLQEMSNLQSTLDWGRHDPYFDLLIRVFRTLVRGSAQTPWFRATSATDRARHYHAQPL